MSDIWAVIVLLTFAVMLTKIGGPLLIGHRELPDWAIPVITVLPGALMTAVIVVQVLGAGNKIVVDERLAGLAAAGLVLYWRRNAFIAAIIAAAATAAVIRAFI